MSVSSNSSNVLAGQILVAQWKRHFHKLQDSRRKRGKRHRLKDVVLLSLLGMICGNDDADEIAEWAEDFEDILGEWFDLKHGTPSQDTVLRVFALIKPESLTRMITSWLSSLLPKKDGDQIAIDGKTLRGSLNSSSKGKAVHIVSAWFESSGLCLGQYKTSSKSNEIKAIPKLLAELDIKGHTVSIDAMGCQKDIAKNIFEQGGHFVLAVKNNQPTLRLDCEEVFKQCFDERKRSMDELPQPEVEKYEHVDHGHGRIETRRAFVCRDLSYLTTKSEWEGIAAIGLLESEIVEKATGKTSIERRYYILSNAQITAEKFLWQTRAHWSIESMHWVLDVIFSEDASRIIDKRTATNFSMLRKTAFSLIKSAPIPKGRARMSIKRIRKHCYRRPEYLLTILGAAGGQVGQAS